MENEASFSPKKEKKKKKKKKGDYMYHFDMCFKKQIFVSHRSLAIYPESYCRIFVSKLKKLKNCV